MTLASACNSFVSSGSCLHLPPIAVKLNIKNSSSVDLFKEDVKISNFGVTDT